MTHVTCRLTAKNRDQLRHPTLGNQVGAAFFAFSALTLLVGWQEGHLVCRKLSGGVLSWSGAMCTVSCFSKIQIGFTFLVPAHQGSPGQRTVNGCLCMCVCCYCWPLAGQGRVIGSMLCPCLDSNFWTKSRSTWIFFRCFVTLLSFYQNSFYATYTVSLWIYNSKLRA